MSRLLRSINDPGPDEVRPWSQRKLAVVAGVSITFAMLLVGGLAYQVISIVTTSADDVPTAEDLGAVYPQGADGVRGEKFRDGLAAAPMLQTTPKDMEPAEPSLQMAEEIHVGPATETGPGDVPTGFERSPEGAVAQLAAIDITVLTPMSVRYADIVHQEWAMEGARFEHWPIAEAIRSFHAAAGTVEGDSTVSLSATATGGQVKGTDGPDWVLACVQLDVTAAVNDSVRFGFGHCERMQWNDGRWMIAPGRPPAPAPSTWPGSDRSIEAGWKTWVETETH